MEKIKIIKGISHEDAELKTNSFIEEMHTMHPKTFSIKRIHHTVDHDIDCHYILIHYYHNNS